jgi:hypothetical protein
MRSFRMQQIGQALPALPGLPAYEGPKTYAAWPVWHDSTTKEVRFQPMPKKKAVKLWHRARDFDRQTHIMGSRQELYVAVRHRRTNGQLCRGVAPSMG